MPFRRWPELKNRWQTQTQKQVNKNHSYLHFRDNFFSKWLFTISNFIKNITINHINLIAHLHRAIAEMFASPFTFTRCEWA